MTIETKGALDDLMKNGLSKEEGLEYQRLKGIEDLANELGKEVPEDVKEKLKQYENKLLSNGAEGVAAGGEGMTQVVNDKRKTLEENFKEEKKIDIGLIRACEKWGINRDKLPEFLKNRGYYNGDIDKIKEAIDAFYKLPEKMTINPEFLNKNLGKKVKKAIKAQEAMKEGPHLYKKWEHQGWGDRISIAFKNEDESYSINGNKFRVSVGDYIVSNCTIGGKPGYFRAIITDIEYPGNPRDYFEGNIVIVNICNEDGSDIEQ